MPTSASSGVRAVQTGLVVNAALAAIKLAAGIIGNTYALVADAIESGADIFASIIVWSGLTIAAQPADDDHPYGHGKAEALAAAVVSIMLLGAAFGIVIEAIRGIRTPHLSPAPWTLAILVGVVIVKWILSRRVKAVGTETNSTAVEADAAHHISDAITSTAAFIGISIAVVAHRIGAGQEWAAADDWAALIASLVISYNGLSMLRASAHDLMDRMPDASVTVPIRQTAEQVQGVLAVEKLHVRKAGPTYRATIHVQAARDLTLEAAHELGARVKYAILAAHPRVQSVLVHMEPFTGDQPRRS
jgi:cation diffusion facilitator family transporter